LQAPFSSLEFMPGMIVDEIKPKLIGLKRTREGYSALIETDQASGINGVIKDADLEAIMVHMEKKEE
jgi:ABC-2 type transport system ATP-binding protein